jgi:hypothetical protein
VVEGVGGAGILGGIAGVMAWLGVLETLPGASTKQQYK